MARLERLLRQAMLLSAVVSVLATVTDALPQRTARQRTPARPSTQWLCQRPECSCSTDDTGLETVDCDCSTAPQQQALLLGDLSAFVSDRTSSLHVHHCDSVVVQSQALSQAVSLETLRLSDIQSLHLQPLSMYTNNGPARTVALSAIGNLTTEPAAFQQVMILDNLMLDDVTAEMLPADLFGRRTDIIDFKLANSKIEVLESLRLPKADSATVENCTIGEMNLEIEDVLRVNITGNNINSVGVLHFNVQPNFHSTDNNSVYMSENNIDSMESQAMEMIVDKFQMINNSVNMLTGPLRVSFAEAHIIGNTFTNLGSASFAAMRQLDALDVRSPFSSQRTPAPHALVFAHNTMVSPAANETFSLLLHPDNLRETNTLFHVYGNRFHCSCSSLQELVESGDRAFLAAANLTADLSDSSEEDPEEDPVVEVEDLTRELYTTSVCEDGRPLSQFRLTAYTSEYLCQEDATTMAPSAATPAAAAAGLLTVMLASVTAGLAV